MLTTSIRRHSFVCFATLFVCFTAAAQGFAGVDQWLQSHVQQLGGRALLVVYKDGKLVYSKAVNDMSRRQKIVGRFIAQRQGKEAHLDDLATDTKLPVASCSKWLSAALVMSFVDEGKLAVTDTVGRWLPVLTQHGKGGITIGQCLSHLTGIKVTPLQEDLQSTREINSMDEAIARLAALPLEGAPGTVFHYSNAGLQIAGAVLEKLSGKSFETLFAERIAGPLQMTNTDFGKGRVALPAGGAQSTAGDYLNFLVMVLNKGLFNGRRVLSEQSIREMQVNRRTPGIRTAYSPTEAGNFGYGYGEWVMETSTPGQLTDAVCSPGLFGSFPLVDNKRKYCAFLLSYNLKSKGRHERYQELKALLDQTLN